MLSWWHDDVIKWKHVPRYWPFVQGIHQSPVNSPSKGQWRGALMVSLICAWTNGWVNNRDACDLGHHYAHYEVIVMDRIRCCWSQSILVQSMACSVIASFPEPIMDYIWVRSQRCGCLVTWFCYQMIAKPGNKTDAPSWPDPYYEWSSGEYISMYLS